MQTNKQTRSIARDILFNLGFLVFIVVGLIIALRLVNILIPNKIAKPKVSTVQAACSRTSPYPIPVEFSRAISIIKQRINDPEFLKDYENCLNIQYADLKEKGEGAEGVFIFDDSVSSPNDLRIYVDTTYKNYDDYLTAILLVHEITHAMQYYYSNTKSCVDKEVQAFYNELVLYTKLNDGERESISARMYSRTNEPSDPIKGLSGLLDILLISGSKCNGDAQCILGDYKIQLRKMITDEPFYQKQCKL